MIKASELKALEIGSKIVCKNGTIELTDVRTNMEGVIDGNAFKGKSEHGEFEYYYEGLEEMINKDIAEGFEVKLLEA
jgi:hypothetical protein